ncbi:hypothetical protein FRC09_011296 [Ceratobasidium sp. 395]|nr:hypothetical protein FRC09_011296 [Ceratobasidium sp. 395]
MQRAPSQQAPAFVRVKLEEGGHCWFPMSGPTLPNPGDAQGSGEEVVGAASGVKAEPGVKVEPGVKREEERVWLRYKMPGSTRRRLGIPNAGDYVFAPGKGPRDMGGIPFDNRYRVADDDRAASVAETEIPESVAATEIGESRVASPVEDLEPEERSCWIRSSPSLGGDFPFGHSFLTPARKGTPELMDVEAIRALRERHAGPVGNDDRVFGGSSRDATPTPAARNPRVADAGSRTPVQARTPSPSQSDAIYWAAPPSIKANRALRPKLALTVPGDKCSFEEPSREPTPTPVKALD